MTPPDDVLAALCEKAGWHYNERFRRWFDADGVPRSRPGTNTDDALALAEALHYDRVFVKMRYAGKIRVTLYKDDGGGASEMHNKAPEADTYAAAIVAALGSAEGVT